MRSSASIALLALVSGAVAIGSAHDNMKRHRMKKSLSSAMKKRDSVTAYYGYQNDVTGSCGWVSKDSDFIVGLPSSFVSADNTAKCGSQVTVSLAGDSSTSITATVTDTCDCDGDTIYLSTAAFKALAGGSLDAGMLDVTWEFGASTSSSEEDEEEKEEVATPDALVTSEAEPEPTFTPTEEEEPETTEEAPTSTKKKHHHKPTATPSTGGTSSDGWVNSEYLTGDNLFDYFNFDTGAADNQGAAFYTGRDSGLVYTDDEGNAVIAVDTTEYVGLRDSVRMVSKKQLDVGFMMIVDVKAMPAGCGMWPAIWLNGGGPWPAFGEIDVVEGVNLYTQNIISIHTDDGCSIPESVISGLTSAVLKTTTTLSCDANVDPAACGFNDNSQKSFGEPFNAAGGGVYAVSVTAEAIAFWFFSRDEIPSDVASNTPTPSSWGSPLVSIPNWECDITSHFKKLNIVINTNLAGSFGEGVWGQTGNGQETSCAEQTGFNSAFEYVTQVGSAFNSPWVIKSLALYHQS